MAVLALRCVESLKSAERKKQNRKKITWHFRLVVLPPLYTGKNLG